MDNLLQIQGITSWGMNQEGFEALGGLIGRREKLACSHCCECCVCLSGVFQCLMASLFPAWNEADIFTAVERLRARDQSET